MILHSYVKLPEGTSQLAGKEKINKDNQWKISQYWLSQTLLGPPNGDEWLFQYIDDTHEIIQVPGRCAWKMLICT
jgi:hypothetical protein